jgi:hypothetical protein
MTKQTKKASAFEAACNTGSGFILALFIFQYIIKPIYGFEADYLDNLSITLIFTVSALVRGYAWRRVFNR